MDLCGRSWRRVVPEAGGKRPSPPNRSRVNGWSRPLHSFQAVAWVTVLILAVANFGIFIPFLPWDWKDVAYGVTGGLFFLHFSVHLLAVSIDPAEPNVRRKENYSEPVPTFDRSKHAHVIQDQYCHLCEVTVSPKAKHCSACNKCVSGFDHHCKWLNNCVGGRNYWYFFLSVASALAGLLCLMAVLLYVSIQFFIDPAELRTHPCYKKVSNENTWLLFLPLFPVKVKTPVVLGIGVLVLLLDVIGLLLLGHLLVFHLYLMAKKLSTFDYMTQGRQQQTPRAAAEKEELSIQTRLPKHTDSSSQSPSAQRYVVHSPESFDVCECGPPALRNSNDFGRVKSKELLLSDMLSHQLSSTVFPENLWPTDSDSKLTSPALGVKASSVTCFSFLSRPSRPRRKVLLSLSRSSGVSSATTTAGPGSTLSLKVSEGLQ
ncbi:palmitoyltransferase ZDHHC11-like [Lutra lutra]|uniref:palmitoyltransferase ZDHHC11-like n=1 Tax=Lutra lutra TaxID=9657 RepID=UPI001FD4EB51|nr:palmitoyltransferase ZDHHC11-like [Lutra lutra]